MSARRLGHSIAVLLACLMVASIATSRASADFGLEARDAGSITGAKGIYTQAGGHPYISFTAIKLFGHPSPGGFTTPDEPLREATVSLPAGLLGNTTAVGQCSLSQLTNVTDGATRIKCPMSSIIGRSILNIGGFEIGLPLYNMKAEGVPARWAINFGGVIVFYDAVIRSDTDYGVDIQVRNISQALPLMGNKVDVWGVPADPIHDGDRCHQISGSESPSCTGLPGDLQDGPNSAGMSEVPYVTMPTRCTAVGTGLDYNLEINSWPHPTSVFEYPIASHLPPNFPAPESEWGPELGTSGCDVVQFEPKIKVQATTQQAESPTGLNVQLSVPTDGLLNPDGIAQSTLKDATVRLPQGMSINPSAGEGLGVCTPAQYAAESESSLPGQGCPDSSKIGTVELESPLIDQALSGSLFIAAQDDNPFHSLLAMYVVVRNRDLGVIVKLAGKVTPDPETGQLVTTFDDNPQLPFSKFTLSFREGARSPLVTPAACGTYTTEGEFTPWANPETVVSKSSAFQITSGVGGAPCPTGGLPPFKPDLLAGSLNNAAGRFSPFTVRLSRNDGEQEFTHFSIKLPPGISGKLAGIPYCPDATLEAAKQRSGTEELAAPSCPAASEVGRTLVGAGVGSVLTYAPGKLYLAGPYHGAPISIAAITAAKVGPFDIGTVVVRQALRIDPETAEVFIDATGSDPIPHIIKGIVVHARDIRAYVDRPNFTLNPTNCKRTSTASTALGSGFDFASPADDNPITVTSPFQAADCAALPFDPKLSLGLLGGTKRGSHPKFRATLKMRGIGEAAIRRAQVTLPHSEFLENAHIKTICTRVQFKAGAGNGAGCPAASVYGYAKATTPILDEAFTGPVFLRSSEHQLPDLVAALHSPRGIDFALVGRIDSVKGGGIRNTFEAAPDVPVTAFTLTMQGGKKGLLVNSTDLCKGTHRAEVSLDAHNGKEKDFRPAMQAKCGGKVKKQKRSR